MDPQKRSPLSSIENVTTLPSNEEIELRELSEPLLTTNEDESPARPIEQVDETTPLSVNVDDEQEAIQIEPTPDDDEPEVRQRRRSSPIRDAENTRQTNGLGQTVLNFCGDLFPANNRKAWCLPIVVLTIFSLIICSIIAVVVMGYETVEYDEFGVTRSSLTGVLDLKNPYSTGIYIVYPWETMMKFDKTARYLTFDDLTIFTTDQASIILDAAIVYRIRPDQIEPIWLNFASKHEEVLSLVAQNILRNHGNQFSIYDYRARREHVEDRLSRILQHALSGDCCPSCCQHHTCSKTIEKSCVALNHCTNKSRTCSNGYFVDIDAVYIYKVALPQQIIKRLYTLMLKPIFTEIAESQEKAAVVQIETERQRNTFLNKARETLMKALAEYELVREKARIKSESVLLNETSSSELKLFDKLNINVMRNKLSTSLLLELHRLANLTQMVNVDNIVANYDEIKDPKQNNDLFDFVPQENVFDMTEFLSILDN